MSYYKHHSCVVRVHLHVNLVDRNVSYNQGVILSGLECTTEILEPCMDTFHP